MNDELVKELLSKAQSELSILHYHSDNDAYTLTGLMRTLASQLNAIGFTQTLHLIKQLDRVVIHDTRIGDKKRRERFNEYKKEYGGEIEYLLSQLKTSSPENKIF